jgi:3-keto-L-gulonate-6-phosphate decarboxylase
MPDERSTSLGEQARDVPGFGAKMAWHMLVETRNMLSHNGLLVAIGGGLGSADVELVAASWLA